MRPEVWIPISIGIPLSLIGLIPVAVLGTQIMAKPTLIVLCLASVSVGVLVVNTGLIKLRSARSHPIAADSIRLPAGWKRSEILSQDNKSRLGIMLVSDEGVRFAVVIRPYQGVMIKRFKMGKTEALFYKDGRMFTRDPVKESLAVAEDAECLPVLWLPNAKAERPIRMKCGLVVVQGNERHLIRAIHGNGWLNTLTQRLS